MKKTLVEYLPFYRIPAGRYLTAIRRLRDQTAGLAGAELLHQVLVEAVAEAEAQFDLEMRWRFRKSHRAEHGAKAVELDRQLDQYLHGVYEILLSQRRFAEVNPERAEAARAMRERLFPSGAKSVTQLSYADQSNAIFRLLKLYDDSPSDRALAAEIGLTDNLEAIRGLNGDYAREISASVAPPRREEVLEGRERIARRLGEVVARIFGMFPTENPQDQEARAALMEPIERQNEALRLLYKRHGRRSGAEDGDESVLDIDPNAPEAEAA